MGTITKTIDSMMDELDLDLQIFCTRRDFESCLNRLEETSAAGKVSRVQIMLLNLFKMFDNAGIAYESGKSIDYYRSLISNAILPGFADYENRVLHSLFKQFMNFPSPSQYLERLVRQYSNPEDHWENETLRLQILRQFIKYGNCLTDAGFGGKMVIRNYVRKKTGKIPDTELLAEQIDDDIFNVLETTDKSQKKPSGKFGLLKLSDDLANEKFRAEGATRQGLYLFAMVYNLRFEPCARDTGEMLSCDLEKNLFHDYYSNNLMRWLSDFYRPGMTEYELDPTGMGINFKNFAEVIYLYYLTTDYSPHEKIRRSYSMIKSVIDETGKVSSDRSDLSSERIIYSTGEYRSRILGNLSREFPEQKAFQELSEEELKNIILTHFDTNVWKTSEKTGRSYRIGEIQVMNTQNGAWIEYKKLLRRLDELKIKPEDCTYGLWFTDVETLQNNPGLKGLDTDQIKCFLKVLEAADSYLKGTLNASSHPLKITSSERVTRSALLFAYYYWFNEYYFDEEELKRIPFGTFFQYFKNGMGDKTSIDEIFEASCYQPLSGRNILDVLTAFSSYVYLNT